jgi:hypothetical protein
LFLNCALCYRYFSKNKYLHLEMADSIMNNNENRRIDGGCGLSLWRREYALQKIKIRFSTGANRQAFGSNTSQMPKDR